MPQDAWPGSIVESGDLITDGSLTVAWMPNGCLVYSYATLVAFGNIETRTLHLIDSNWSATTKKHINRAQKQFSNRQCTDKTSWLLDFAKWLQQGAGLIEMEFFSQSVAYDVDAAGHSG